MNQKNNTKTNITVIMAGLMVLCMMLFFAVTPAFAGDRLNYRLKWQFNTSVAGDIIADTGGFFKKAGLDVFVKEGGAGKNAIKELELRYANFGVASADQVIRALERGADVVVLAQLFQVNPMQWIYRSDQPEIKTLSDLNGRYIGVTFGGNDETIMNTLLAKAGLTSGDVFISSVRSDFTPFLKKEVDMWPVYRNTQGVILEDKLAAEGEQVKFFNPADYGIHFVANSVVTSGAMMKKHPDTVKAFIAALLSAWEFAMDPANEAQVLAQIKKKDTFTRDDIRKKQLEATRPLIKPDKGTKIGIIDARAWRQTESIMVRTEQIMTPVDVVTCLAGPKKRKIP